MDPLLLPRVGNSHAELPLVANPHHEFVFDLGLISKSVHVVLHGYLFLKAFSLPFWVLLFFHWKTEASPGTESPLKYLQMWCRWLKHIGVFLRGSHCACTVAHLWRRPHYSPKDMLDPAQTQTRASPCPMKSACHVCRHGEKLVAQQDCQRRHGPPAGEEAGEPSYGPRVEIPLSSLAPVPWQLTTQQQDNLWSRHTHCLGPVKDLLNHHSKKSEPRETLTVRWRRSRHIPLLQLPFVSLHGWCNHGGSSLGGPAPKGTHSILLLTSSVANLITDTACLHSGSLWWKSNNRAVVYVVCS